MKKSKFIADFKDIPSPRQKMPELPIEARKGNFEEVELGFSEEMAVAEARRCLSCRRCIGCGLCLAECAQKAIEYDQSPRTIELKVDAVILTPGAEKFNPARLREYGYSRFSNVITSIELERILSPTGPFAGFVLRPGDGEVPKKVAFVQCVGSRNEELNANYCSNVCCMVTLKQALQLQEKIKGVTQHIFFSDMRPFAQNGENTLRKAQSAQDIKFSKGKITEIRELNESGNISLMYNFNGDMKTEEFELVVLAVGMHKPSAARSLSRSTKIQLNSCGFYATDIFAPGECAEEGVCIAGSFSAPKDIHASVREADAAVHATLSRLSPIAAYAALSNEKRVKKNDGGRTAVYLCEYGLRERCDIDLDELKKKLSEEKDIACVESSPYCCSRQGIAEMRIAAEHNNLNKLIIAPCYPETHSTLFEQLLSVSSPSIQLIDINKVSTEGMSSLIKTALMDQRKAGVTAVNHPTCAVVVLGAGFSGMSAALHIAKRGIKVHLIEKSPELGGAFSPLMAAVFAEDAVSKYRSMIARVQGHKLITVHLKSELTKFDGQPGRFTSTIQNQHGDLQIAHGALLLATGAAEYIPREFGYSKDNSVITQAELEDRMLSSSNFSYTTIVMIQCIGSRNEEHPYCSSNCCLKAIINAIKIKNITQECQVHILHRDIRLHDFQESFYSQALEMGVQFTRINTLPRYSSGKVRAVAEDTGGEVCISADLVVLSNGIITPPDNRQLAKILNVKLDDNGFFCISDKMYNSVETEQAGIYVCGLARSPMTVADCASYAAAAAARACAFLLQCS